MRKAATGFLVMWMVLCLAATAMADIGVAGVLQGSGVPNYVLQPIAATLNQKMSTRSGPSTGYTELGTFQQSTAIVVFEQEMGSGVPWGMVEFQYKGTLMRAYTGMKRIDALGNVPWGNTTATDAITAYDVVPHYGPGDAYAPCSKTLPAGSLIQAFHEESGYVMADFYLPGDSLKTRAWIPVGYLSNYTSSGQTGHQTTGTQPVWPTRPGSGASTTAAFDVAGEISGFVDASDNLWMMGRNDHGEIGVGYTSTDATWPREVLSNVVDVQLGDYSGMALDTLGNVYTWGWNRHGQAGVGDAQTQYVATPGRVRLGNVAQIASGGEHNLALITNGSVYAWGRNTCGQLANGSTTDVYAPTQIIVPGVVDSLYAGRNNTAVILWDGSLWMAGDNSCGQLCQPASQQPVTSFVRIPLDRVAQVALGERHVAAVTMSGDLYVWGDNTYGQVGNWQISATSAPQLILSGIRAVAAGDNHTMAVANEGTLYAWGRNDNGQLGDGTTSNSYSPEVVMRDVAMVRTGYGHTVALGSDGTLWGVGLNGYAQLGLQDTSACLKWTRISPVR